MRLRIQLVITGTWQRIGVNGGFHPIAIVIGVGPGPHLKVLTGERVSCVSQAGKNFSPVGRLRCRFILALFKSRNLLVPS